MRRKEQNRKLLEENSGILLNGQFNNGICFDGIVDEVLYENVVVLLKEANGCDASGKMPEKLTNWNYCKWLKEQQVENKPEKRINKKAEEYEEKNVFYHSTFRKLCYWLSLLFDTLKNEKATPEKFLENGTVNISKVRSILNRVAVVNLKKSWGDKQTNENDLRNYAIKEEIRNVLKEQMKILAPKIVLCCSPAVFNIAIEVYAEKVNFFYTQPSKTIPGKEIEFAIMDDVVYINFYHPQYYGKTDKVFSDYAVETFEQLKKYLNQR